MAKANDQMLQKKWVPPIAFRRAGATFAYSAINLFFGISKMIIPGSSCWSMGMGRIPGEILKDEEGVETFKTLGKNMA